MNFFKKCQYAVKYAMADNILYGKFRTGLKTKIIMRLNLVILFVMLTCLQVIAAKVNAQSVTLKVKDASVKTVFDQIMKQTGYMFFYKNVRIKEATNITIELKAVPLRDALDRIMNNQPFTYEIVENTIVIKEKTRKTKRNSPENKQGVTGVISDENGQPLVGASVTIKGTNQRAMTNSDGKFSFQNIEENTILVISYIGYQTQEVASKNASKITLYRSDSKLDEVQIIAYGTSTKRLNTGSVATVSAKDIDKQPVSNPLAALSGKVPGLVITQSSGQTGASFNVQVRGQNSIAQNSDPLFIVDGVPFATNNDGISQVGGPFSYSLARGRSGDLSPFNNINPNDIESIEILKDADATAIYGSRGANGVVLITTKKGKAGKTKIDASFQNGYSQASRIIEMMNTDQYLAMRKEAFVNDGVSMTNSNAFDVLLWDSKRNTDWGNYLLGGTANTKNVQANVSGGNDNTQFLIGANYYHETTVSPGELFFQSWWYACKY